MESIGTPHKSHNSDSTSGFMYVLFTKEKTASSPRVDRLITLVAHDAGESVDEKMLRSTLSINDRLVKEEKDLDVNVNPLELAEINLKNGVTYSLAQRCGEQDIVDLLTQARGHSPKLEGRTFMRRNFRKRPLGFSPSFVVVDCFAPIFEMQK